MGTGPMKAFAFVFLAGIAALTGMPAAADPLLAVAEFADLTAGKDPIILPDSISIGDAVSHVREEMETERGLKTKFTFSGSVYFERMKEKGLYTTDKEAIVKRVKKAGLQDVFNQRVM